jgi:p-aminobenzoyl-glutamate transporter AbgT
MRLHPFARIAAALAAVAISATMALAGGNLPPVDLADFAQTKAKSFEDFSGRAVLIEFFAFW